MVDTCPVDIGRVFLNESLKGMHWSGLYDSQMGRQRPGLHDSEMVEIGPIYTMVKR